MDEREGYMKNSYISKASDFWIEETNKPEFNSTLDLSGTMVIVDDEDDLLDVYSMVLNKLGIKHKTFQDPLQALSFISKHEISGVFTDYHMKGFGISGKWIKELCIEKNIPCYIVSGDNQIADISKLDFLNKYLKSLPRMQG